MLKEIIADRRARCYDLFGETKLDVPKGSCSSVRILTIDIEDWFHILEHESTGPVSRWDTFPSRVEANTDRILDELSRRDLRVTFFCLGWIAERFPKLVRRIADMGHEIGTHSYAHQLVHGQTIQSFRRDLRKSFDCIGDITGQAPRLYRAPGFSVTPNTTWVFEELIDQGIDLDCSIFPAPRAHGGFAGMPSCPCWITHKGIRVREMPMSTGSILGSSFPYSGGGYFRFFPYPIIRRQLAAANYVMSYFHPRDFDPLQPRLSGLSLTRKFRTYVGLTTAFDKFQHMLNEFTFVSVSTASKQIDWSVVPVVNL